MESKYYAFCIDKRGSIYLKHGAIDVRRRLHVILSTFQKYI